MNAARLEELGKAMFGTWWQSEIGHALGKPSRGIRFWATGTRPISDDDAKRIEDLAVARLGALARVIKK